MQSNIPNWATNLLNALSKLRDSIGGEETYTFDRNGPIPNQLPPKQVPQAQTPIQKFTPPIPPPATPRSQNQISPDLIRRAIEVYGGKDSPAIRYAQQIADASNKYEFLRNNPFLVPVLMHLETSSGRNITRPNNLLNWGINYPGNNQEFSKMQPEQVLDRALSGIGERSPYYNQFRTGKTLSTDELKSFGKQYEPANQSYPDNLVNGVNFIQSQLGTQNEQQ